MHDIINAFVTKSGFILVCFYCLLLQYHSSHNSLFLCLFACCGVLCVFVCSFLCLFVVFCLFVFCCCFFLLIFRIIAVGGVLNRNVYMFHHSLIFTATRKYLSSFFLSFPFSLPFISINVCNMYMVLLLQHAIKIVLFAAI